MAGNQGNRATKTMQDLLFDLLDLLNKIELLAVRKKDTHLLDKTRTTKENWGRDVSIWKQ